MRIELRQQGVEMTNELRAYVERRLTFALARFGPKVTRVTAFFSDQNGPRAGADKRCRLVCPAAGAPELIVETDSGSLEDGFEEAVDRLNRLVSRQFGRPRDVSGAVRR